MNFPAVDGHGRHINDAPVSVWREQMKYVTDMGYRYIDPVDDWLQLSEISDERFVEFKKLLDEFDLGVWAVSFGRRSPMDSQYWRENIAAYKRMIDRAEALQLRVVNIGFMQALTPEQQQAQWFWHVDGYKDDPALRDVALERVADVAQYAERHGVEIALELYEDTFLGSGKMAAEFVQDLGEKNVGINPDVGNFVRLHREIEPWKESFEYVLPYANYWHIKNYVRDFDPATGAYYSFPAALEDGYIDYRWVIQRALDLGYHGAFMTEHYGGDWLGIGARNARYIREILELTLSS
ncbi:MAG: sugar phosphate isomerase/epimerase [Actinomycetaceae bacterium]|nr:sugar phosphate isomerase/epimerase [Actinomycetaceae bacterium]MDY5272537.1 sugar phosphate isomerase/epimerase family protein [Arcanobacterium sp.]